MTKDELWQRIAARYPDGADLSAAGLRKMFDTVWLVAHSRGLANGRALEQMEAQGKAKKHDDLMGWLGDLFGRKPGGDG